MTEVTLEPCPLCNGHAVMWEDGDPKYPWCVTFEHADECPLYAVPADFFRSYPTEAEAAAAWNTRASRATDTALVEALEWYGEQARLARLIHSEGDAGRHALQADGGKRARTVLEGKRT